MILYALVIGHKFKGKLILKAAYELSKIEDILESSPVHSKFAKVNTSTDTEITKNNC